MIAIDERWNEVLRVDVPKGFTSLIPIDQVDILVINVDSLEVKGDANPIGGRRPPEAVKFHVNTPPLTLHACGL